MIYNIKTLCLQDTCQGISMNKFNKYMENSVKANGLKIRKLIKLHLPDLFKELSLEFYNPYECQSKRTKTHFIYVHSSIEYFLKFN